MTRFEKRLVNSGARSRSVARRIIEQMRPLNPHAGQTLLDCGCGVGTTTIDLAVEYGLEATGVDVDPEQIEAARRSPTFLDVRFETADCERLPYADGAFDYVVCYRVTHHIPRWRAALAEMIRVTAPGGHLVYTDFMTPSWAAGLGTRLFPRALGFPTLGSIDALVERFGLETVRRMSTTMNLAAVWRKPEGDAV